MTNNSAAATNEKSSGEPAWRAIVAKYQKPSAPRAGWQLANTLIPYGALWYLISLTMGISWWLCVPMAILAGGFLVRMFIIHHDCGHASFFKSRAANHIVGFITGVITFTPYYHWRWEHAQHHATSGDLDRRGTGDIWTLTVQEYLEASRWQKFAYRLARNPFILFVLAPLYIFLIKHRIPNARASKRDKASVYWTNAAVALFITAGCFLVGWKAYLVFQVIMLTVAGSVGVWLFYVQHQFEGVYWGRGEEWDYQTAALQGSSFYKLPRVLQWFSGNIGFHHIHHLSSRIPNYHLNRCHKSEPLFQAVKPITLWASFKSFTFRLWDEQHKRLVGYGALRNIRRQQQRQAQQF